MAKVYHEYWGELEAKQLALYKKMNVSASDHDTLVMMFGDDTDSLIAYVRENSDRGYFRWV